MNFTSINNLPVLDLGERVGDTQYIDFIKWDEVTSSAMTGIDILNRPFVVVKFKIDNETSPYMQTFFQRYTNEPQLWMGCGHAMTSLMDTTGGMKPVQQELINRVIDGNRVVITKEHRPTVASFVGKKVGLC
jgi:hypothetical protein